jgi:hypothetical protein
LRTFISLCHCRVKIAAKSVALRTLCLHSGPESSDLKSVPFPKGKEDSANGERTQLTQKRPSLITAALIGSRANLRLQARRARGLAGSITVATDIESVERVRDHSEIDKVLRNQQPPAARG